MTDWVDTPAPGAPAVTVTWVIEGTTGGATVEGVVLGTTTDGVTDGVTEGVIGLGPGVVVPGVVDPEGTVTVGSPKPAQVDWKVLTKSLAAEMVAAVGLEVTAQVTQL